MSKNKIKQTTMNFDNSSEYLNHLVYDGAKMRYGNISEEIKKRLNFELQVINSRNWAGYFLLIRDMVYTIRTKGAITGPGGGALPGSLVAYCLQITDVDPLAYGLLFERFANSEYNLPSFYVCVDIEGKNEAIGYLKEKGITNRTDQPVEQIVGSGDFKSISVFSEAEFEIYLAGMKSLSVMRESAEKNGELSDIFENADMNVVLRRFRPSNIEELAAMYVFACFLPHSKELISSYIARKHGREKIQYELSEMEKHLKNTYGLTIYQEQVMSMSRDLAGFSPTQSNELQKALGKKLINRLNEFQKLFLEGCNANGYDKETVLKIWNQWSIGGAYFFNKSHAICVAIMAAFASNFKNEYHVEK